jgi:hypothetical protein
MTNPEQGSGVHPRVTFEQGQTQFEAEMEDFSVRAEFWDLKLADAQAGGANRSQLLELAEEGIEELDGYWPYHDEMFIVSGTWIVPQLEIDYDPDDQSSVMDVNTISWNFVEREQLEPRRSHGWGYKEIDGKVRVGLSFSSDSFECQVPFLVINVLPMGFALPEKVSLTHIPEATTEQIEVHGERVRETLELHDKLIRLYMSQDSFLRESQSKQRRVLGNLIQDATENITSPGTGLYLDSTLSEFFVRSESSTAYGFEHVYYPDKGIVNVPLKGVILGLAVLEQSVLEERPLQKAEDFIDRSAGLCLIMEVYRQDHDPATIYVPYKATVLSEENLTVFNAG